MQALLIAHMMLTVPLFVELIVKKLPPKDRWMFRSCSKEVRRLMDKWHSNDLRVKCYTDVVGEVGRLLRSSSVVVSRVMDEWAPDAGNCRLGIMAKMSDILNAHLRGTPAFDLLTNMVKERLPYGHMGPLRKWFKVNRVGVDEVGFYTRLPDSKRVRIGMWETGVDFVTRKQAVKFFRGYPIRYQVTNSVVLRPGYEICDPAALNRVSRPLSISGFTQFVFKDELCCFAAGV